MEEALFRQLAQAGLLDAFMAQQQQQQQRADFTTNKELVDSLKVKNERVELALRALSRGWFAPISQADVVYMDQPFPINGLGFNFSAPHMYAMCLEKLDLQSGHTFLDIGSGTGHMTCLGGLLVGPSGSSLGLDLNQTTIDFSKANQRRALLKCSEASSGVHLLSDSERQGLEQVTFEVRNCFLEALEPKLFDRIHVGASCPRAHIAELTALLKPGGIMVLPNESEMLVLKKGMDSEITEEIIALVRYSSLTIPSASDQKLHKVQNALKRMKATISVPAPAQASTFDIRKWTQSADRNWQEQGMDSDLTVTVGTPSTAYHVHRSVFMARSDHFHAQFTSGMKDADVTTIDLPDNSPRAFELFLHYIYLDTCDFNEDDAIAEVLQLASFYQVPRLIALCEAYLRTLVNDETVCDILDIADRNGARQLKAFCLEFICMNSEAVLDTPGFKGLSSDLLADLIKALGEYVSVVKMLK